MASTRNINDSGNYKVEQYALEKERQYMPYKPYAVTKETYFAGDGLLPGRFGNQQLSNNAVEIETFLYGIGSCNLVTPLPPIVPDIKQLKSLNMIDRIPVILPDPLVLEPGQRLRLFE
jgi:hypothetical protein